MICIVRVKKSGRMRWAGHVARMGKREGRTGFWCGDLMERDHFEELEVNGRVILKWIIKK